MSTTTARHATPPVPPPVRDPFIRGPKWLELALALALVGVPLYASAVIINRWVYVIDNTPPAVIVGLVGMVLATLLGFLMFGYAGAVLVASWTAQAATAAQLGVAGLVARARRHRHADAGRVTLDGVLHVAVFMLAAVALLACGVQLAPEFRDDCARPAGQTTR